MAIKLAGKLSRLVHQTGEESKKREVTKYTNVKSSARIIIWCPSILYTSLSAMTQTAQPTASDE